MYTGKLVFSQVLEHLPLHVFHQCVDRYDGNYKVKEFTCLDQYLCMAFAQLTYRESLRDIESCLRAQKSKLYHMGIRPSISRNNLANANKVRDWRIYADLAYSLIQTARKLYANESFGLELENTVYALDATTIDLCLSMFPWANFRKTKGAIKLHTLRDLRGSIPSFIHISDGKVHEVNILDIVPLEAGAFYVMDRGYTDFKRLYAIPQASAFFVIRAKSNLQCRRVYSNPVDKATGLLCDQSVLLTGYYQAKDYPDKLRRVKYYEQRKRQNSCIPDQQLHSASYDHRRTLSVSLAGELFFRWIKQNLRIKTFYGTSENAVKAQIWIAVSVYVLVAIMKKRLKIEASLYTILQVLSVTIFERMPLLQALTDSDYRNKTYENNNQLFLFS